MRSPFGQALRVLQVAALLLVFAVIINLAVHGWLGAFGAWSGKEAHAGERLAHLLIACAFTVLAAGLWYALSFEVRPFE